MIQEDRPDEITEQNKVDDGPIPQALGKTSNYSNSEIDLIDLWLMVYRRKWLLLLMAVLFTLVAAVYVVTKPAMYSYSASLQVGVMDTMEGEGHNLDIIEEPEFVVSRLNEAIIPYVLHRYKLESPEVNLPEIKAHIPRRSGLIMLEIQGPEQHGAIYTELINKVAEQVVNEHQPLMDIVLTNFQSHLKDEQIKLAELEDPSTLQTELKAIEVDLVDARMTLEELNDSKFVQVLRQELESEHQLHSNEIKMLNDEMRQTHSELALLDQMDGLIKKQVTELEQSIKAAEINRKVAQDTIEDKTSAMTLLLLDNQIQSNRDQLAKLEQRLAIEQPARRDELNGQLNNIQLNKALEQKNIEHVEDKLIKVDSDIANQKRQQSSLIEDLDQRINKLKLDSQLAIQNQKSVIENAQSRLGSFKATGLVFEPMRSMVPIGVNSKIILVAAAILGLLVGIFLIFGMQFKTQVSEKLRQ